MKKLVLTVLLSAGILFSCSTDNTIEQSETNFTVTTQQRTEGSSIECVEHAPCKGVEIRSIAGYNGGTIINITWSSNLSKAEIECARNQYFHCFPHLKMTNWQPSSIFKERWWSPQEPEVGVEATSNDDPRACVGC